ncbi:hypothetical protein LZ30DRAFT_66018 [Colletotrichum cereale]|nr:hypothetical protein LZ30DRAFT_66018 [Colletotrichum cereale]
MENQSSPGCAAPWPVTPPIPCKSSLGGNSKLPLSVTSAHPHSLLFSPRRPANPSHRMAISSHLAKLSLRVLLASCPCLSFRGEWHARTTLGRQTLPSAGAKQPTSASAQSWLQQSQGGGRLSRNLAISVCFSCHASPTLPFQLVTWPKPASQPDSLKRHPTPKRTASGATTWALASKHGRLLWSLVH